MMQIAKEPGLVKMGQISIDGSKIKANASKHKVEAPFGWIKRCLGFRSFSLRGVANVRGEFAPVCLAMNPRRLTERMAW